MRTCFLAVALILPLSASGALAAGSGDSSAPSKPKCKNGQVYDAGSKSCVNAQDSRLDVDTLYQTVRELAYVARYDDARTVLAAMPQDDDRTLTYLGFVSRKTGQADAAMGFYTEALRRNPANVLARSYMGQGLVEDGRVGEAMAQLKAIRAHGGSGTWAEASLRQAIATGRTINY